MYEVPRWMNDLLLRIFLTGLLLSLTILGIGFGISGIELSDAWGYVLLIFTGMVSIAGVILIWRKYWRSSNFGKS